MNETIEADLDAKATGCTCCGQELTSKDSGRLCSQCVEAGCDPAIDVCQRKVVG